METNETIKIEPNGRVYLFLPPSKEYKQVRQIGRIIFASKIFLTYRKQNHYYRKYKGIGVNYKFLSEYGSYFDTIKIEYDSQLLITSRLLFLEFGKRDCHEANLLDEQIFLDLELFGLDNIEKWKRGDLRSKTGKKKKVKTLALQFSLF